MSSEPKPGLGADPAPNLTVELGIGGYYTNSNLDRMLAFDYLSTGNLDHLVIYRPGSGIIWILQNTKTFDGNNNTVYVAVYKEGDPSAGTNGQGIGGYNLTSTADRIFAFDYEGSGKLDDLVLYRPGMGIFWILQNTAGSGTSRNFGLVYPAPGSVPDGIGNFNLSSPADQAFAFDYAGTGNHDHLVLYRPGTGIIWILQNNGGASNPAYVPVYQQGNPNNGTNGQGIGGYNLTSTADRVFAFDYESSGKLDDLVLYRPGMGIFWILQNTAGSGTSRNFGLVYPAPGSVPDGIGNFDLSSPADQAFAFDYAGTGNQDHLVLYRPGTGTISVVQNDGGGNFAATLQITGDTPLVGGLGGFDLWATVDQGLAFDYAGTGNLDYLIFYRPGTGTISILKNEGTSPPSFDDSPYNVGLSSPAQVQQNLINIRALNTDIFNGACTQVSTVYFLINANQGGTNWAPTVGFQLFAGAFWAVAGVGASIAIVAASASFIASFVPGMLGAISGGGSGTQTFAGLLATLINAHTALDGQLSLLQSDPVGTWNTSYNNTPLSNLANTAFPIAGESYNVLYQQMLAQAALQIWETVLNNDYVKTQFNNFTVLEEPPAAYFEQYYQKNPAYYMVWYPGPPDAPGYVSVWNIGTGVNWDYPLGSDGGMNVNACAQLFQSYSRLQVFIDWPIPNAKPCNHSAPGPEPPGSIQPPPPH